MKNILNKVKIIPAFLFTSFMFTSVVIFFVQEENMGNAELIFVIALVAVVLWASFFFGQQKGLK